MSPLVANVAVASNRESRTLRIPTPHILFDTTRQKLEWGNTCNERTDALPPDFLGFRLSAGEGDNVFPLFTSDGHDTQAIGLLQEMEMAKRFSMRA